MKKSHFMRNVSYENHLLQTQKWKVEGFSFVTPITSFNWPSTGKEDDDDDEKWKDVFQLENIFCCYFKYLHGLRAYSMHSTSLSGTTSFDQHKPKLINLTNIGADSGHAIIQTVRCWLSLHRPRFAARADHIYDLWSISFHRCLIFTRVVWELWPISSHSSKETQSHYIKTVTTTTTVQTLKCQI
jgi:hypothetical protein